MIRLSENPDDFDAPRLAADGVHWYEGADEEPDREPTPEQERAWDLREDDARGHALSDPDVETYVPVTWGTGCRYCARYRRPCGRHEV